MKKFPLVIFLLVTMLLVCTSAQANFIQNSDFSAFTGAFAVKNFEASDSSDWGVWIDRAEWESVSGGATGNFARQGPTNNTTDLLMQGWNGALTPAGTELTLEFDYIYQAGYDPKLQVYGLAAGGSWNYYAGWTVTGGTSLLNITDLGDTQDWAHRVFNFTVPDNYAAIAIGFTFGGDDVSPYTGPGPGTRGIDNVSVNAVPEPATLLLLGFGLVGLAGVRRFKK